MKLSSCVGCGLPVLELEGQFAKLDSYYIANGDPPVDSAGWWHVKCLQGSRFGESWYAARLRNFVGVRGATTLAELPRWTVIESRGERMAVARTGELVGLTYTAKPVRVTPAGAVYEHFDSMFNLELEDRDLVATAQRALLAEKSFPLTTLLAGMQIADRIVNPDALADGRLEFQPKLQQFWSQSSIAISMRHGVLVPAELRDYCET
jgi:hypothetical protein